MAKKKSQVKESLQITQTPTEGFYSPLDMQFHPAPKAPQKMTVDEMEKLRDKYRHELEGVPVFDGCTDAPYDKPKETTVDDIISGEYGYCINSLTGPQRALLSELIRIRLLMEGK